MAVYFFSDLHLGSGNDSAQREKELCNEIDRIKGDADAVVLLGDMFDFWFTYRYVVPRGGVRLLGKLAELSDKGVELHYFVGNHDMWLFDYLESEMNIAMHDDPVVLEYYGKRILCGHGDGLGHLDKRYDMLRRVFRCRLNQRLFAMLPQRLTFGIACGWSHSSRKSHKSEEQHYLGQQREGIVLHCIEAIEHEQIDYCLFGHRHTPLIRQIESPSGKKTTYVNTGDWITHRSYARYSPDTGIELIDLNHSKD